MATRPVAYVVNVLEASVVTAAGALATKPVTRVYDRSIGEEYEDDSTTGDRWVAGDQTGALSYHAMLVGPGHNQTGMTVHAETDSGSGFASRGSVVPASDAAYMVTLTGAPLSHDDLRLRVTSPGSALRITELFFAAAIEFPFNFSDGGLTTGWIGNVTRVETVGGTPFKHRRGPDRWQVTGAVTALDRTAQATMKTIYDGSASGTKPFFVVEYLSAAAGVLRYVEWIDPEAFFRGQPMTGDLPFTLREIPWGSV